MRTRPPARAPSSRRWSSPPSPARGWARATPALAPVGPRHRSQRGLPHRARDADVVLLDEDRGVEARAVGNAATHLDRVLLEEAQPRRRLARVSDAGARAGDRVDETPGEGGDTARALEEVE